MKKLLVITLVSSFAVTAIAGEPHRPYSVLAEEVIDRKSVV